MAVTSRSSKRNTRSRRSRLNNTGTVTGRRAKVRTARERPSLSLRSVQDVNFMVPSEFSITTGTTPGGIRSRGRELVYAVPQGASPAFAVTAFNLTPLSFPRLQAQAGIYEEYFFHSAVAFYQPILGTNTNGAVSVWFDFDAGDPAETTQAQASRNIVYAIANAYAVCSCHAPGSLSRLKRFLNQSGVVATALQLIQAQVRVATEGIPLAQAPAASVVGYIYIEYDVEFYVPN